MPNGSYEIRLCASCGLRYPLVEGHAFGTRCPICLGDTRLLLRRELPTEPRRDLPESFRRDPQRTGRRGAKSPTATKEEVEKSRAVLLDNIRSTWNTGSILRSADGFGFAHAYLCGITPTPENEAVQKTSLGAEDSVTWSYHKDAVKLARGLKKEGWKVYALEEDERAKEINSASRTSQREVLVIGNEVTGVDLELLDLCDEIFYIPMRGEKRSFNVAMAFSVAAYAITNGV